MSKDPKSVRLHPSNGEFADELTRRIELPHPLAVVLLADRRGPQAEKEIHDEMLSIMWEKRQKKMEFLLKHYGLNVCGADEKYVWMRLSYLIAFDYVDGFFGPDYKPQPRKKGRPKGSGKLHKKALFNAINEVQGERHRGVSDACQILSKRKGQWKGLNPKSLETRYYEAIRDNNRLLQKFEQFKKAEPDPDWERLLKVANKFPRKTD